MTPATCVIYNPVAGRGRAKKALEKLPAELRRGVELWPTEGPGHAVDLARAAADQGFAKVVAAGGDGTVHEVANGVLLSGRRDVVFSTWPLGSANDYAYTLGLLDWWRCRSPRPPTDTLDVDIGRISGGKGERYYVNSLGIGFNGMVTVEARKIRYLRGVPLYTLSLLIAAVRHFQAPRMWIRFDDEVYDGPTLALTLNLAQREGGFRLTPAASLSDGLFDYVHATSLTRLALARHLPGMMSGNLPSCHPNIRLGRTSRLEVRTNHALCIHADGEYYCVPADGVREIAIEIIPARLRVEIYRPALYGRHRKSTQCPPQPALALQRRARTVTLSSDSSPDVAATDDVRSVVRNLDPAPSEVEIGGF